MDFLLPNRTRFAGVFALAFGLVLLALGLAAQAGAPQTQLIVNSPLGGRVTSNPGTIDCGGFPSAGGICNGFFTPNSTLTLTATPDAGKVFFAWNTTGFVCPAGPVCTFTVPPSGISISVSAIFADPYSLSVSFFGTGNGSVASNVNGIAGTGIACGTQSALGTACSAGYAPATEVILTATPQAGSMFAGWSNGCSGTGTCTVTMNSSQNISAQFVPNTLSVNRFGTGTGNVTSLPAGLDCGATCSFDFNQGASVTLTPVPTPGSFTESWSGCDSASGNSCTVAMPAPRTVSVTFTLATNIVFTSPNSTSFNIGSFGSFNVTANGTPTPTLSYTGTLPSGVTFTPATGLLSGTPALGTAGIYNLVFTAANGVTANVTQNFALRVGRTVTPSAGANGQIVPSTPVALALGATASFSVIPAVGFGAVVGGSCGGTLIGTTYTTNAVITDCSVSASFVALGPDTGVFNGGGGAILDHATLEIPIVVSGLARNAVHIALSFTGTHTWVGDLKATLSAPGGATSVVLFENVGATTAASFGSGANLAGTYIFADDMPPNLWVATAGGGGTVPPSGYRAAAALTGAAVGIDSVFAGMTPALANGTWKLGIFDRNTDDTGNVTGVTLGITTVAAGTTYNVTPSAGIHGSIGPNIVQAVTVNTPATFTVVPEAGYTATVGGTCGGNLMGTTYTTNPITADCTVVASFAASSYALTVNIGGSGVGTITSSPAGINCGLDCSENYTHGTMVTLTAAQGPNLIFAGWGGGGCSGTGACVLSMAAATHVTAIYSSIFNVVLEGAQVVPPNASTATGSGTAVFNILNNTLTLNLTFSGLTGGAVTAVDLHLTSQRTFPAGVKFALAGRTSPITEVVTILDEVDQLAIGGGLSYVSIRTAAFPNGEIRGQVDNLGAANKALTVVRIGSGTGRVAGTGIDCGTDCTESYAHNFAVTLVATADVNSTFAGWSGGDCSGTGPCTVTMDFLKTVTATFNSGTAVNLTAVLSRKTHGTVADFDLPVDTTKLITEAVTVEPRSIGSGHLIVFQFDAPVTVAGTVTATPVGSAVAVAAGNEVRVTLTGVADNRRATITLTGVNGTTPATASMGFLVGDVNNTRSVNSSDISGVKARSGQPTTALNFKFDVNSTGAINSSDISAVKARSGSTLPP